MKINDEDKKILKAYESGSFKSVPDIKKEIVRYREYAKSTLQKNKRINIRISERDLVHIQTHLLQLSKKNPYIYSTI